MIPRKKTRIIAAVILLGTLTHASPLTAEAYSQNSKPVQISSNVSSPGTTWYPPGYSAPEHKKTTRAHVHPPDAPNSDFDLLVKGIHFFQKYISPVDSPRCPMYPTCSAYALQALERHGPVVGTFLTVDRLLHETSAEEQTIPLQGFERIRYYDPLENNDFWLKDKSTPVEK